MNFFKWVFSYFKPYKILVVTPEKQYLIEFHKGEISTMYHLPEAIRGRSYDMVWMDEASPRSRK